MIIYIIMLIFNFFYILRKAVVQFLAVRSFLFKKGKKQKNIKKHVLFVG